MRYSEMNKSASGTVTQTFIRIERTHTTSKHKVKRKKGQRSHRIFFSDGSYMIFKYFRGDFKFCIEHGRNKNIFEICSQELVIFAKLLSTYCHYRVPYLYKINKKIIKFWDYACYLYFLLISEVSYF